MRRGVVTALGGVLGLLLAAAPAGAARVETIEVPSRYVDPATAIFAGGGHVDALRASVLLPDGYDASDERFPVLYLLHPTGGDYKIWLEPEGGNIIEVARDLRAIVVMPEAGLGFLSNWWNDGLRADPAWERHYFEELVPLIKQRYRILPGRRGHAIAGWSMGGMGAVFLAGQRPEYFGTAVSLSGFVSIQRPYLQPLWEPAAGVNYEQLWGSSTGFYATGHNPAALTDNLRQSRLVVTSGDGKPRPGMPLGPGGVAGIPFESMLEQEVRMESNDLVAAAEQSGVDVTYLAHDGIHTWPHAREDLRAAIDRGLFGPVPKKSVTWDYKTVAQTGRVWGFGFRFARPPEEVVTLRRRGDLLSGDKGGAVTVTTPRGCAVTVEAPFKLRLPVGRCTDGRIRLSVAPKRARAGTATRFRLRATTLVGGRRVPVPRARIRVGRHRRLTGRAGRAAVTVAPTASRKCLVFRATKRGLRSARVRVRVLPPRSRTSS